MVDPRNRHLAILMLGRVLYGALFVLVLPVLLLMWARAAEPNIGLPTYGSPAMGALLAAAGFGLMLAAMTQLWQSGGGLPMNAFPPPRLVSSGLFRWLPHPIYTGFTAVLLGAAMYERSAAGLWLVTPVMALACAALVFGYERQDLHRRFPDRPVMLPPPDDAPPSTHERVRFHVLVTVPWILLYELTIRLPYQGLAFRMPFEDGLPLWSWTIPVYQSTYLTVAILPWLARTRLQLRKTMISGWVAMALIFPFYWIVPSAAPRPPLEVSGWLTRLLNLERSAYPPVAAFPSFHVLWAILAGRLVRPRWLGAAYAASVSVSCVTTGMHYIADIAAAALVAPFVLEPGRAWRRLLLLTERIANSWREWRVGRFRFINHGIYASAAGFVQVLIVCAAIGPGLEWKVLVTAFAGLAGAAAWAQWVEGSSLLRRPFGFYGGLISVGLASLLFPERWTLLAAHCLGAPWMQAIGRLRCLVNGCCHGAPTCPCAGIRVTHPRSRVTRLSEFAGIPIHPTPLYSMLANVAIGLFLARLWVSGASPAVVCAVYTIGNGLARFVEEAYRGEPQTAIPGGLRLYQWIAMASVVTGAIVSTLPSPAASALAFSWTGAQCAACFAATSGLAMGADYPDSNRPLARLT